MKYYFLLANLVLATLFSSGQPKIENLKITWPEEYKWKIGSSQEDGQQQMIELIPGKETINKWTIMGTMLSIKGTTNTSLDFVMNIMFEKANQMAINPKLTLVERADSAKHPWIMFRIEATKFKNDSLPESQLYYIIQGETSLYSNFVSVKKPELSKEFVDKWTAVFKNSELIFQ